MKQLIGPISIQSLLKITVVSLAWILVQFFLVKPVAAQATPTPACPPQYAGCAGGCLYDGHCIGNKTCAVNGSNWVVITNRACGSAIVGKITPPQGVIEYNTQAMAGGGSIGIILFVSRLIRIFTIVSGIWIMANFILAGVDFITTAGNPDTMKKVQDRLTYSMIGIVIIAGAYTATAVIGLIFFGDAGFILNPDLASMGALGP